MAHWKDTLDRLFKKRSRQAAQFFPAPMSMSPLDLRIREIERDYQRAEDAELASVIKKRLPQELQDQIFANALAATLPTNKTVVVSKSYQPPPQLSVNKASRTAIAEIYYSSTTFMFTRPPRLAEARSSSPSGTNVRYTAPNIPLAGWGQLPLVIHKVPLVPAKDPEVAAIGKTLIKWLDCLPASHLNMIRDLRINLAAMTIGDNLDNTEILALVAYFEDILRCAGHENLTTRLKFIIYNPGPPKVLRELDLSAEEIRDLMKENSTS